MRFAGIQKVIGFLILGSSLMMLPPFLVSLFYADNAHMHFFISAIIFLVLGLIAYLPVRHERRELQLRDGFLIVTSSWLVMVKE